jgi:hypothetical protein
MLITTFLLCLAWGVLTFFFVLLVRIGAKPAPQPPGLVCCPHCVVEDQFRPMLPRSGGGFICQNCGHTAIPEKPEFSQNCGELNRAA